MSLFPAFHMERVKVSVPSTRNREGVEGGLIQQGDPLHGEGQKGGCLGGDLGRGASPVTKILGLDWRKEGEKRKGAVNTVACKARLASSRLLEGRFGRKWSSDSGAQLNGSELRNIRIRVGAAQPRARWDFAAEKKTHLIQFAAITIDSS